MSSPFVSDHGSRSLSKFLHTNVAKETRARLSDIQSIKKIEKMEAFRRQEQTLEDKKQRIKVEEEIKEKSILRNSQNNLGENPRLFQARNAEKLLSESKERVKEIKWERNMLENPENKFYQFRKMKNFEVEKLGIEDDHGIENKGEFSNELEDFENSFAHHLRLEQDSTNEEDIVEFISRSNSQLLSDSIDHSSQRNPKKIRNIQSSTVYKAPKNDSSKSTRPIRPFTAVLRGSASTGSIQTFKSKKDQQLKQTSGLDFDEEKFYSLIEDTEKLNQDFQNKLILYKLNDRPTEISSAQLGLLKQEMENLELISSNILSQFGAENSPQVRAISHIFSHYAKLSNLFSSCVESTITQDINAIVSLAESSSENIFAGAFADKESIVSTLRSQLQLADKRSSECSEILFRLSWAVNSMSDLLNYYKRLAALENGYSVADMFLPFHSMIHHSVPSPFIENSNDESFVSASKENDYTQDVPISLLFGPSQRSVFNAKPENLNKIWPWMESSKEWPWISCLSLMSQGYSDQFFPIEKGDEKPYDISSSSNLVMNAANSSVLMIDSTFTTQLFEDASYMYDQIYSLSVAGGITKYTKFFPFEDLILGSESHSRLNESGSLIMKKSEIKNKESEFDELEGATSGYLLGFVQCTDSTVARNLLLNLDGSRAGSILMRCRLCSIFPTSCISLSGLFPISLDTLLLGTEAIQDLLFLAKKAAFWILKPFSPLCVQVKMDGTILAKFSEVENSVRAVLKLNGRKINQQWAKKLLEVLKAYNKPMTSLIWSTHVMFVEIKETENFSFESILNEDWMDNSEPSINPQELFPIEARPLKKADNWGKMEAEESISTDLDYQTEITRLNNEVQELKENHANEILKLKSLLKELEDKNSLLLDSALKKGTGALSIVPPKTPSNHAGDNSTDDKEESNHLKKPAVKSQALNSTKNSSKNTHGELTKSTMSQKSPSIEASHQNPFGEFSKTSSNEFTLKMEKSLSLPVNYVSVKSFKENSTQTELYDQNTDTSESAILKDRVKLYFKGRAHYKLLYGILKDRVWRLKQLLRTYGDKQSGILKKCDKTESYLSLKENQPGSKDSKRLSIFNDQSIPKFYPKLLTRQKSVRPSIQLATLSPVLYSEIYDKNERDNNPNFRIENKVNLTTVIEDNNPISDDNSKISSINLTGPVGDIKSDDISKSNNFSLKKPDTDSPDLPKFKQFLPNSTTRLVADKSRSNQERKSSVFLVQGNVHQKLAINASVENAPNYQPFFEESDESIVFEPFKRPNSAVPRKSVQLNPSYIRPITNMNLHNDFQPLYLTGGIPENDEQVQEIADTSEFKFKLEEKVKYVTLTNNLIPLSNPNPVLTRNKSLSTFQASLLNGRPLSASSIKSSETSINTKKDFNELRNSASSLSSLKRQSSVQVVDFRPKSAKSFEQLRRDSVTQHSLRGTKI